MTPLEYARSQLGVREATGHNDGLPSERYADGEQIEWCASFIRACFEQAGTALPGNRWKIRACATMLGQLRLFDCEVTGTEEAEPGDVVFFDFQHGGAGPSHHVGLVEHVDVERQLVNTIEGNSGDMVARRQYRLGDKRILAICRWDGSKAHQREV